MNHFVRGKWESAKIVPTVGVKRFPHSRHAYRRLRLFCFFSERVFVSSTVRVMRESFPLSQAKQRTPCGQRIFSRKSKHCSSLEKALVTSMRFIAPSQPN